MKFNLKSIIIIYSGLISVVAVLLFFNLSSLGLWEGHILETDNTKPAIYRINQKPISTELSDYLNLEQPVSSKWSPMVQWIFRGFERLPLKAETATRFPSALFILFLFVFTIFWTHKIFDFKSAVFTGIVFFTSSFFFMYGKHFTKDMLWIFFSTSSFLLFYLHFTLKKKVSKYLILLLSLILLIFSFLSKGLLLGLLLPVFAVFMSEVFNKISFKSYNIKHLQILVVICSIIIGVIIWLTYKYGYHYIPLLYEYSNPAITVPHGKDAHSIFTVYFTRAVFSMFPWSIIFPIALISFFSSSNNEKSENTTNHKVYSYLAGWLFVSFLLCTYWTLRFGDILFLSITPVSIISGIFISKNIKKLFTPFVSLFTLLWGLLLFLNLKEHPYILAEIPIFHIFKNIQTTPGIILTLTVSPFLYPFFYVMYSNSNYIFKGLSDWWNSVSTSSFFIFLAYLLLYPFIKLFEFIIIKGLWAIWLKLWRKGVFLFFKIPHFKTFSQKYGFYMVFLITISFIYGFWGSIQYIPELSDEFSTANLYRAYDKLAQNNEKLGVYRLNGNSSQIYINKKIDNMTSETASLDFLSSDKRTFLAISKSLLGKYDHLFRMRKQNYYVPYKPFPKYILLSNKLLKNEKNYNPLLKYVSYDKPIRFKKIYSNFNNKVELIGYNYNEIVKKGQSVTVTLYFKVLGTMVKNYKIFIHLDPPYGNRITGDHKPVNKLLPTKYWTIGTYITDSYTIKIPYMGFPAGKYRIYMGLFKGPRLKIIKGKHTKDNRVPLGTLIIKQPWAF